jgi:hypothetical protein
VICEGIRLLDRNDQQLAEEGGSGEGIRRRLFARKAICEGIRLLDRND